MPKTQFIIQLSFSSQWQYTHITELCHIIIAYQCTFKMRFIWRMNLHISIFTFAHKTSHNIISRSLKINLKEKSIEMLFLLQCRSLKVLQCEGESCQARLDILKSMSWIDFSSLQWKTKERKLDQGTNHGNLNRSFNCLTRHKCVVSTCHGWGAIKIDTIRSF